MIDAAFGTPLPAPPPRAAGSSRVEHAWVVLATVLVSITIRNRRLREPI